MRFLLDTHAFLWMLEESPRLSVRARAAVNDPAREVRLSFASTWEITIKATLGKLRLRDPWEQTLDRIGRLTPNLILQPAIPHFQALYRLPRLEHRDPFDRMLVAQALAENLPLVSNDESLDNYGVTRLW